VTEKQGAVLDASALLAYLQGEPGGEEVAERLLEGAHISAVNWAEVLTKLADRGRSPLEVTTALEDLGILGSGLIVETVDAELARGIAELREPTKKAGLSLGDRACLALGARLQLPVLTTDRVWKDLGLPLEIKTLREVRER